MSRNFDITCIQYLSYNLFKAFQKTSRARLGGREQGAERGPARWRMRRCLCRFRAPFLIACYEAMEADNGALTGANASECNLLRVFSYLFTYF